MASFEDHSTELYGARIRAAGTTALCDLGLEIVGYIGIGFSSVYLARSTNKPKDKYKAVKIFPLSFIDAPFQAKLFLKEVSILQNINHPHIIGDIATTFDRNVGLISMDYYPNGTLLRHLGCLDGKATEKVFIQIACALRCLHRNRISHGDVKPDNILLKGHDAILTDFSMAVCLEPGEDIVHDAVGTPIFMAPEVQLASQGTVSSGYNPYKADSYSMGVVLWMMMMKACPSYHVPVMECLIDDAPNECPFLTYAMEHLLAYDAKDRRTVTSLLKILSHMGWNSDYIKSL